MVVVAAVADMRAFLILHCLPALRWQFPLEPEGVPRVLTELVPMAAPESTPVFASVEAEAEVTTDTWAHRHPRHWVPTGGTVVETTVELSELRRTVRWDRPAAGVPEGHRTPPIVTETRRAAQAGLEARTLYSTRRPDPEVVVEAEVVPMIKLVVPVERADLMAVAAVVVVPTFMELPLMELAVPVATE